MTRTVAISIVVAFAGLACAGAAASAVDFGTARHGAGVTARGSAAARSQSCPAAPLPADVGCTVAGGKRVADAPTADGSGVVVSPTSLEFGDWPVGVASAPLTLTVRNDGGVAHSIMIELNGIACAAEVSVPCSAPPGWRTDFYFTTTCPRPPQLLPPAAECSVEVTFSPHGEGSRSGAILVYPGASPFPVVALSGAGHHANVIHDEAIDGPLPVSLEGLSDEEIAASTFELEAGAQTIRGSGDGSDEAFVLGLSAGLRLERIIVAFDNPVAGNALRLDLESGSDDCTGTLLAAADFAGSHEYGYALSDPSRSRRYLATLGSVVVPGEPMPWSVTFVATPDFTVFSAGFDPCAIEPLDQRGGLLQAFP